MASTRMRASTVLSRGMAAEVAGCAKGEGRTAACATAAPSRGWQQRGAEEEVHASRGEEAPCGRIGTRARGASSRAVVPPMRSASKRHGNVEQAPAPAPPASEEAMVVQRGRGRPTKYQQPAAGGAAPACAPHAGGGMHEGGDTQAAGSKRRRSAGSAKEPASATTSAPAAPPLAKGAQQQRPAKKQQRAPKAARRHGEPQISDDIGDDGNEQQPCAAPAEKVAAARRSAGAAAAPSAAADAAEEAPPALAGAGSCASTDTSAACAAAASGSGEEVAMEEAAPSAPQWGGAFDPSSGEHVSLVKGLLAISGSRCARDPAPLGRSSHFGTLHKALAGCCETGSGRSVYISGLPGTGKSFTVSRVLGALEQEQEKEQRPPPVTVSVNCMALADTKDVYGVLLSAVEAALARKAPSGAKGGSAGTAAAHHGAAAGGEAGSQPHGRDGAYDALVETLTTHKALHPKGGARGPLLVLVLDEVDRLLQRGPDEMYRLFMLPHIQGVSLALIAIANSLDLTERMLPALRCRGLSPDFLCFPAYSKGQVQSIMAATLAQLPWPVFEAAALELVARTVSTTTGDLRHAFKVCRTALDSLVDTHARAAAAAAAAAATATAAATAAAASPSTSAAAPSAAGDTAQPQAQAQPQQAQAQPQAQVPQPQQAQAQPQAQVPQPRRALVGPREMLLAVRSMPGNQGGSSATIATVKALPNQQQLVLLAASLAIAGADAAASAVREAQEAGVSAASVSYAAIRAQKAANPFAEGGGAAAGGSGGPGGDGRNAAATPPRGVSGGGGAKTPGTASKGGGGLGGDAALRVSARDVYDRYTGLCKELYMRPVHTSEFLHTCVLLQEQALLNLVGGAFGTPGGRGGGGGRGGANSGAAAVANAKISLKVMAADVRSALSSNPIYKKVIGA